MLALLLVKTVVVVAGKAIQGDLGPLFSITIRARTPAGEFPVTMPTSDSHLLLMSFSRGTDNIKHSIYSISLLPEGKSTDSAARLCCQTASATD